MKWLVKMFLPSADTLAKYAAEKIQSEVNAIGDEKREKVEEYAKYGLMVTGIADQLAKLAADGKVDSVECEQLAGLLRPIFARVLKMI